GWGGGGGGEDGGGGAQTRGLRKVVGPGVEPPPPPPPPRPPATARPGAPDPVPMAAMPPAVAIPSAVTDSAASADPRESGRGRDQHHHDHQKRDDGCLFHGYPTAFQPRPLTYIVSIPRECQSPGISAGSGNLSKGLF